MTQKNRFFGFCAAYRMKNSKRPAKRLSTFAKPTTSQTCPIPILLTSLPKLRLNLEMLYQNQRALLTPKKALRIKFARDTRPWIVKGWTKDSKSVIWCARCPNWSSWTKSGLCTAWSGYRNGSATYTLTWLSSLSLPLKSKDLILVLLTVQPSLRRKIDFS